MTEMYDNGNEADAIGVPKEELFLDQDPDDIGLDPVEDGAENELDDTEEGDDTVDPAEVPLHQLPHFYAYDREQQAIRPADLITGEAVLPGEIPPIMMQDPDMQKGETFWREHGEEMHVRVLTSAHMSAGDLREAGVDLRGEAERLAALGGVLFIEGTAPPDLAASATELYNLAATIPPEHYDAYAGILDDLVAKDPKFEFGAELVKQVMGTGVQVVSVDYVTGGERMTDKVLTIMKQAYDLAEGDANREARRDPASPEASAALVRYLTMNMTWGTYRDAQFVGRMGAELAALRQERPITDAAWWAGHTHRTVGVQLRQRGVSVDFVPKLPNLSLFQQRLIWCKSVGKITARDIAYLKENS